MTVDAPFRPSSARTRPQSAICKDGGASTPATRPGSAAPCRRSPESFRSNSPPLYSVAGVYSGAPVEVQLPSQGGQMGAIRLDDNVFRALRPYSAARGQRYPTREQTGRPSTAPSQGRQATTSFSQMLAGPVATSQHEAPSRPSTAPIATVQRIRTVSDSETAILQEPDIWYGDDDGISFGQRSEDDRKHGTESEDGREQSRSLERDPSPSPSFGPDKSAKTAKDSRRRERLKSLALHSSTVALRRNPWRASVFLSLKKEVLEEDDPKLRTQLRRLVQLSTQKACQQTSYFVYSETKVLGRNANETGQSVSLWPWVGQCNVTWYGNTYPRTTFDMEPSGVKEESQPAVVSTCSVLESALRLSQACPEHPIVLLAEAVDFDVRGDIDQRSSSGVLPHDLLLQSDFGRLLDQIHRSCHEYNQNAGLPNSTMRDYLQDKGMPFIARFNEVSLFRGCESQGFPFLEAPVRLTVILMALPEQRVKYQQVHYQNRPSMDWYEQLGDYDALVTRFFLAAKAIRDNAKVYGSEAPDGSGKKPIVIMGVPGCASNVQQPHDAVANCLKHWKQNYSHLFEALHICCRNRRGPDEDLCTRVRAAVNLRERPPPGLDVTLRDQGPAVQKKRIVADRAILDDPLDEDATDEAVARFRKQREITVEMGQNRRGSVVWTSDKLAGFWRKRKEDMAERQRVENAEGAVSSARSQALAMASVNLWVRKKSADMLGFIPKEEESDSLSSEDSRDALGRSGSSSPKASPSFSRAGRRASTANVPQTTTDIQAGAQRRASSACADWTKEQPDWLQQMDEKVAEMREFSQDAQKRLQAKAAGKLLAEKVEAKRARFAMRRRSSVTGTLGAGEDFQVFTSQAAEPVVEKHLSSAEKKELGSGVRQEAAEKTVKPKFVTDESLKLREQTRRRLTQRLSQKLDPALIGDLSQQASADASSASGSVIGSRRPSAIERAAKQAEDIEVASKRTSLQEPEPELQGRLRFNWKKGESFVMPTPPDRPFASADTQFRRRNMRENIMIFRARNEESLTHAGLLDVELGMAECEGVALQLAQQVNEMWQKKQAELALKA